MVDRTNQGVTGQKFLTLKSVFILAKSEDLEEMPHSVALHQGLHCNLK